MEGNESVTLCYSLFFEGLWQVTVTSYQNTLKNIKAERKIISGGFLSSYDSCSRPNQCSCSKTQSICHSFGPLWSRRSCQTQTFPHVCSAVWKCKGGIQETTAEPIPAQPCIAKGWSCKHSAALPTNEVFMLEWSVCDSLFHCLDLPVLTNCHE